MTDKELKLVAGNASRTLVERGRSCAGRGKWRGCRCYLLTETRSRRISLAGKKAERGVGLCVLCVLPADRYTQQTHQSRREKSRAAETRSLCVCVSEERGRGTLPVLVLPADRYTKLGCCFIKKKYEPRHFWHCLFFLMQSQQ